MISSLQTEASRSRTSASRAHASRCNVLDASHSAQPRSMPPNRGSMQACHVGEHFLRDAPTRSPCPPIRGRDAAALNVVDGVETQGATIARLTTISLRQPRPCGGGSSDGGCDARPGPAMTAGFMSLGQRLPPPRPEPPLQERDEACTFPGTSLGDGNTAWISCSGSAWSAQHFDHLARCERIAGHIARQRRDAQAARAPPPARRKHCWSAAGPSPAPSPARPWARAAATRRRPARCCRSARRARSGRRAAWACRASSGTWARPPCTQGFMPRKRAPSDESASLPMRTATSMPCATRSM